MFDFAVCFWQQKFSNLFLADWLLLDLLWLVWLFLIFFALDNLLCGCKLYVVRLIISFDIIVGKIAAIVRKGPDKAYFEKLNNIFLLFFVLYSIIFQVISEFLLNAYKLPHSILADSSPIAKIFLVNAGPRPFKILNKSKEILIFLRHSLFVNFFIFPFFGPFVVSKPSLPLRVIEFLFPVVENSFSEEIVIAQAVVITNNRADKLLVVISSFGSEEEPFGSHHYTSYRSN